MWQKIAESGKKMKDKVWLGSKNCIEKISEICTAASTAEIKQ